MKPSTALLSNQEILEIRFAVNQLSPVVKDTAQPVYDLGFEAAYAFGRTYRFIRDAVGALDDARKKNIEPELRNLDDWMDDALSSLEGQNMPKETFERKRARLHREYEEKKEQIEAPWKEKLKEKQEVQLYMLKRSKIKIKGPTPPSNYIELVMPMIEDDSEEVAARESEKPKEP